MDSAVEKDDTQLQNNNFGTYVHVWIIMSSHVFSVSVLLPFLLFVGRIQYQPHVCQLIPKVWTHNWANFNYIRVAIYVYRWSFWFSICGNFVSWCRIRPALWPIALNSCLMIHYLLYLDGVYIRMEGAMTVGLTVLTLHSFMEARIRHCGIFILRSRLLVLTLNGKPARNSCHPWHN